MPIIAGAAGGGCVLILVLVVIFFVRRARSNKAHPEVSAVDQQPFDASTIVKQKLSGSEINPGNIKLGPRIGGGNFGTIYLALLIVSAFKSRFIFLPTSSELASECKRKGTRGRHDTRQIILAH